MSTPNPLEVFNKPEVVKAITEAISASGVFATKTEVDKAVADLRQRVVDRTDGSKPNSFSISRLIRGLKAIRHEAIDPRTAEGDVNYIRALETGTTPGSYLVPTIQANEVISLLSISGIMRAIGPRVWPMAGIEKLTIPTATATPTVEWLGENTAQTASDPNLGQVSLDLNTMRALVAIPNELLSVSSPAVDAVITELLAIGHAEKEDTTFFATTKPTGGFDTLYAVSGTTTRNCFSANGGQVRYVDLLGVLQDAYTNKAKAPFVWTMHPRSFFGSNGCLNVLDGNSRPIVQERAGDNGPQFSMFGYPVFLSPLVPVNQTLGSGTSLSYIAFFNPKSIQVGDSGALEIAISTERYFDANQTAIRSVRRMDVGYAQTAGICILKGVA